MGIDNGTQLIFKMTNVVARELDSVVEYIRSKSAIDITNSHTQAPKSIDCDVSNIIHKMSYRHSGIYSTSLVREVAIFLKTLATDTGYIVNAVLDGDTRPHSKRDAFKRRYNAVMNQINSFYCRQSAMQLAAKSEDEMTAVEKENLLDYNKEAQRLDASCRSHVPPSFKHDLECALEEVDAHCEGRERGGHVNRKVLKAEYESDYLIAYRIRTKQSTLVYSTDSDMTALCGPMSLSMRSFSKDATSKKKKKKGENEKDIYACEIAGGSNTLMKEIQQHISTYMSSSQIEYKEAKYPILEENVPPFLTALYLVGLGCDVIPGGVPGITPLVLWKELVKLKAEEEKDTAVSPNRFGQRYTKLVDFFLKKDKSKKLSKTDIRTYGRAVLFQPAVEMDHKEDPSKWKYIFNRPTSLPPYLKIFAHPDGNINIEENAVGDAENTCQCKGMQGINLPHTYLKCEGTFKCSECNQNYCTTCGYSPVKDRDGKKTKHSLIHYKDMDKDTCVDCYKQKIFLPHSCNLSDVLSIDEMKTCLRDKNQMLGSDEIAPHEVQELFELTKVQESRKINADNVPFPCYRSNTLDLKEKNFGFGELVHSFDLENGGQFIHSPDISDEMLPSIITLLSSIVRYDSSRQQQNKPKSSSPKVVDVLPSIFIDFAEKSRVGDGFRLLKRCLRHALDPKIQSLDNTTAHLFRQHDRELNGKDDVVGLVLTNKVPASMKEAVYHAKIAFTANDLIATQCDCHAGGNSEEQVLCVHGLPVLYQLVMLMDDGLAEHLLVELCSRWHAGLDNIVKSNGKYDEVRDGTHILMQCAGESKTRINEAMSKLTISETLNHCFATGTQRSKKIPTPPSIKELRPIRNVDFSSNAKKAAKLRKRSRSESFSEIDISNDGDQTQTNAPTGSTGGGLPPDYYEICTSIKALDDDDVVLLDSPEYPGFQLLSIRANNMLCNKSTNAVRRYVTSKKNRLKDDIKKTFSRGLPRRTPNTRKKRKNNDSTSTSLPRVDDENTTIAPLSESSLASSNDDIITSLSALSSSSSMGAIITSTSSSPGAASLSSSTTTSATTASTANATFCVPVSTGASPSPPPTKKTKRGPRKKCCFINCTHTERTDPKMTRIHPLYKDKPSFECAPMRDVRRYVKRQLWRQHLLKACGKKDEGKEYFLCTHHETHQVTKTMNVTRVGKNNNKTKQTLKYAFELPTGLGVKATAPSMRPKKGLGDERIYNRLVSNMKEDISHLEGNSEREKMLVDSATTNAELVLHAHDKIDELQAECSRLQKEVDECEKKEKERLEKGHSYNHANASQSSNAPDSRNRMRIDWVSPVITYHEMKGNNAEVKRRTGLQSLDHMIAYILVICNGDHDIMTKKETSLTWLEEWFLYFEFIWGRTLTRWIDVVATYKTSDEKQARKIFRSKLDMVKSCRKRWPTYASHKEDHQLMKDKWKEKFKGMRVVMWDDTNVNLSCKPGGADEQRLTYSMYYGGNCAKGGVFLQPCGWMGVEELWVGATSDSFYQEKTKIFEKQDAFAKQDLVDGKHISFTNILDKGYRVNLPAWRAGKQTIIQPTFAKSDTRFTGRQTTHTADVATTRSGNERAVNRCELSGCMRRGMHQRGDPSMMDDVWLCWSFQTNFMFKSVL